MNKRNLIEEIKTLRELKYTWKQIQETLFQEGSVPSIQTLMRWVKGTGQIYFKTVKIPLEHKDEIEKIYIRQLQKMGFTSSEIKKELKNLMP